MASTARAGRWSKGLALVATFSLAAAAFACTSSETAKTPDTALGNAEGGGAPIPADVRMGDAPTGMWSGALPGSDAFVAIVASPVEVIAYVCDKGETAEWFRADGPGKAMVLTSSQGVRLTADLSAGASGKATGSVTFPERDPISFEAAPASDPVLRRADANTEAGTVKAGWIDVGTEQRGAAQISPPRTPLPTTGATTSTTAASSGTSTSTLPRIVVAAPRTGPTLSVVKISTTTAKPSTTTTRPATVAVQLPNLQVPVLPRVVTPKGITVVTGNRPLFYVIAGAGDSYASGEGAPVGIVPHGNDFEPTFPIPDGVWGPAANADEKLSREACHRSRFAGAPVAVLGRDAADGVPVFQGLAQKYPGIPIKFIHVACSGAEVGAMVDEPYTGADRSIRPPNGAERPQLDQIRDFVGVGPDARFDSLIMSIGGNNSGFGAVVGGCITGGLFEYLSMAVEDLTGVRSPIAVRDVPVGDEFELVIGSVTVPVPKELRFLIDLNPPCHQDPKLAEVVENGGPTDRNGTVNRAIDDPPDDTRGFDSVPGQYAKLDGAIDAMPVPPQQVLITQYADPSRRAVSSTGPDCSGPSGKQALDILGLVDHDEAPWTIDTLLGPLNQAVASTAQDPIGWTVVSDHVREFRQGHGVCSDAPFVNDNNAALAKQGDDFRDDNIRRTLADIQKFAKDPVVVAIVTGIFAAALASGDPVAITASIGLVALAATAANVEKLLSIAAGIMHPNAAGYVAYARAILPPLEQRFVATMTPETPSNFRQAGGVEGRSVVLRWDDLSDVETEYRLTADKVSGDGPQSFSQTLGPDRTEFTHEIGRNATYRYKLKACNPQFCSDEVTTIGTTIRPATAPTGLKAQFIEGLGRPTGGGTAAPPVEVVSWSATNPDNATTWNVESTQLDPAPTTPQPKLLNATTATIRIEVGTPASAFPLGKYRYRVQACNVLGCGPFSAPVEATTASSQKPDTSELDKIKSELPPNVFLDAGLTGPVPSGPSGPVNPPGPSGPTSTLPGPGPGPDPPPPG